MFLLGLGENLWKGFVPKYLETLGAPVLAIGLYGTLRDFLDGAYQYPGGWIADRYGRRRALLLFVGLAAVGYVVYLLAPSWQWVLAGLLFVMAWSSMASPTLFAVVGDALPRGRRAIGFTVQSILKRVPLVIAPVAGGIVIERMGVTGGIRVLLCVTIVLAVAALAAIRVVDLPLLPDEKPTNVLSVWSSFPRDLRTLLAADVFA